jgi:ATP-dependent Clp protease ATP-binding subunit ClpB
MNMEKMTNKTREALVNAQQLAIELHNNELRVLHVLASLLKDPDGLTASIIEKLGVSRNLFIQKVEQYLQKLPRIQDNGQQIYQSREFSGLLADAARQADAMQDEYISVEHLLLAMFQGSSDAKKCLEEAGLSAEKVLQSLQKRRKVILWGE